MRNPVSNILIRAGKLQMHYFGKPKYARHKSAHDLVSLADLDSEKMIIQELKRYTPKFNIISEEKGVIDNKSKYTWIIDPLDGTTNFIMGNPLFAVVLSLWHLKANLATYVWAPYLKEMYVAVRNHGAFLNGERIHVSKTKSLKNSLITFCHGNKKKDIDRIKGLYPKLKTAGLDFRQLGSGALEMAYLAKGAVEAYVIPGGHLWDTGAGSLLVREAGGRVTDFKNHEWQWGMNDFLGSNGLIHKALIKYLK